MRWAGKRLLLCWGWMDGLDDDLVSVPGCGESKSGRDRFGADPRFHGPGRGLAGAGGESGIGDRVTSFPLSLSFIHQLANSSSLSDSNNRSIKHVGILYHHCPHPSRSTYFSTPHPR